MFEWVEALSAGVSPVEDGLRVVLEQAKSSLPPRRPWVIDESATHGQGPQTGLGRLLDLGAAQLERAQDIDRQMARAAADRARHLAAFARMRPTSAFDRAPGEVGAASAASRASRPPALGAVSEWAADEVAVKLALSPAEATALLTDCLVLVEQLPATLTALAQCRIGWEHARVLAQLLASVSDEKRQAVEARVLARADGKSRTQLRLAARRAILREDADAAMKRAARAIREREVRLHPGNDGMGGLWATLPLPVARACLRALEQYAESCAVEGDERTKAQRMADCLSDLILRPGAGGLPPVQVQLTVVAAVKTLLGGDEPGEVDGDVVPAAVVRELAYTLGLLPRPDAQAEGGGSGPDESRPAADRAASGEGLAELLGVRRISGTALAGRPHIAIVDDLDGAVLALTDAAGRRRTRSHSRRPPSNGEAWPAARPCSRSTRGTPLIAVTAVRSA